MTVKIASVTFDCEDALKVATFWAAALDRPLDEGASIGFASIGFAARRDKVGWGSVDPKDEPTWMFSKVPEPKTAKNRMHLDVITPDPDSEINRLVELGAKRVRDANEYGYTWIVMQDPEGNEFCVGRARE